MRKSATFSTTGVAFGFALVAGGIAVSFGQSNRPDQWKQWEFLVGDWVGEGAGKPGEGTGGFTFERQLDGNVLVRRNKADYPAQGGRPAFSHEDLMIVFPDPGSKRTRAVYFDNEGHVINYTAEFSNGGQTLVLLSDEVPSTPRFRLTYTRMGEGTVEIAFEMAPPGQQAFTPYTKGQAHRK